MNSKNNLIGTNLGILYGSTPAPYSLIYEYSSQRNQSPNLQFFPNCINSSAFGKKNGGETPFKILYAVDMK